ncbi:MAG: alpha-E domain-containing protein [Rikenellaceae bacterium]
MVCNVITAEKANRLFWLGRYAERVYLSLHLLRRYYDRVIDQDIANLGEYYQMLGVDTTDKDVLSEEFQLNQLYDSSNICSIISSITGANDNGIILRHEITSESLAYIQLSKALIEECSEKCEKNITNLQPITDYMLAFFGSVDERVFNEQIRKFIKVGRFLENIDIHIRFNYPFNRISEVYASLKDYIEDVGVEVDTYLLSQLDELISEDKYHPESEGYRNLIIGYINHLIVV